VYAAEIAQRRPRFVRIRVDEDLFDDRGHR
jgi:hypothetical protein